MKDSIVQKSDANYAPHLALLAVQLFFGTAAVLGKLALQGFSALAIVGFRSVGGALAIGLLQQTRGGMKLEKTSHYFQFAVFSLFGIIFNHLLFFEGLARTTAANASLLAVTIPVFAIVISASAGIERISLLKVCGIVLASAGAIYLIDVSQASFASEATVGNLLLILNSFSYATYIVISKKLVSHYGALKSIAWIFLWGVPINGLLGLFSLLNSDLSRIGSGTWLALAGVVIFPTILAYYLNAWALTKVNPSAVAAYTYLQPLFGFAFAVFFLGEHFTTKLLISALLIFAGVFLVTRRRKREIISKV